MTVTVKVDGIEGEDQGIRHHAAHRVTTALRRFHREISDVLVRIVDENGARGGVDTRCRVVVSGARIGTAMIESRSVSARTAVDGAAGRLARVVARQVDRLKGWPAT